MGIGTTAAILGSAVIGAGTSAMSASKSNKAIQSATDQQAQVARESNALQGRIYDENVARSQPFVQQGLTAGQNLNALLGLGGDGQAASNAFQTFKNSGPYGFNFNEGMRALNSGYAAKGMLQSGAAQKAAIKYGGDMASNTLGQYMGLLANQQGVGLSASNALSGVGTNYANAVSNNNANAASAIGNGALARAGTNNALMGGFANLAGNTAGQLSSYGGFGGGSLGGFAATPNALSGGFANTLPGFGSMYGGLG